MVIPHAVAVPAIQADFDVVIVGAGAAGIAAARRVAAAGLTFVVLEASDRWGGRCFTDRNLFGFPYELGARWIYMPEFNPLAKLAIKAGANIDPMLPVQRLRIGVRHSRVLEMEEFLGHLMRCNRAFREVARGEADVSCAQALPKDLDDWRPTMEFVLGPFRCGKGLGDISALDHAASIERDVLACCRQGLGTLLGKLAVGSPIQYFSPVTRIVWDGMQVRIETRGSTLSARAVIVTASTGVLAADRIRFQPGLPARFRDAISKLALGSYDHVAIEFAGNPLGLKNDELVLEKATGPRTAALLANVAGSRFSVVDIAGTLCADLADTGETAMTAFAIDWLAGLFGTELKRAVKRTHVTRWGREPWALGAFAAASPGAQGARRTLAEPLDERIWFAGDAIHEALWGTVGGAWQSGETAADAAIRRLGRKSA